MAQETLFQKVRLEKQVTQLRRISQAVRNRTHGHQALELHLRHEEDFLVDLLATTGKHLRNLKNAEDLYSAEILKKGKHQKKLIDRDQNFLANVYYRLDEARKLNDHLTNHLDRLVHEEKAKINTLNQLYYIGQYITLFSELENHFIRSTPDDFLVLHFSDQPEPDDKTTQAVDPTRLKYLN